MKNLKKFHHDCNKFSNEYGYKVNENIQPTEIFTKDNVKYSAGFGKIIITIDDDETQINIFSYY